jgi:hypothetical protein
LCKHRAEIEHRQLKGREEKKLEKNRGKRLNFSPKQERKKVTWDMGNMPKTKQATSHRSLFIYELKNGEGCAGDGETFYVTTKGYTT